LESAGDDEDDLSRFVGIAATENSHIRDKIRQQLQELRKLGFVEFLGGGRYRL